MKEEFEAMRQSKKQRHQQNKEANTLILVNSGLLFASSNNGEALLFRDSGKPVVDFYPSSGKWKVGNQVYNGGAESFLNWYAKQ